jgi:DNA-binding helix-hairpin-helix protein with protein kinase domain
LFIFDDKDDGNRPVKGFNDAALVYWPLFPEFLRALFTRAFTRGIRDPQHGRVLETDWRVAMAQLRDLILPCPHCAAESFHDDRAGRRCWACGGELPQPRRIALPGFTVVAAEGAGLFPHHLDLRHIPDASAPIARVVRNKRRADLLGLQNDGGAPWRVTLPHGEQLTIAPGDCVGLHPQVRIRIGNVEAEII